MKARKPCQQVPSYKIELQQILEPESAGSPQSPVHFGFQYLQKQGTWGAPFSFFPSHLLSLPSFLLVCIFN